jgi:prophage tail gpP-like protein
MPKASEIASIVANGQNFQFWETVEISRLVGESISYMRFTPAEPGNNSTGWAGLRLMPGDQAQGYLAGQLAATGIVVGRQVFYDATTRSCEITVASNVHELEAQTVDGTPGQYLNNSFSQICKAVCGKVGVAVNIESVPGADKVFERVSEHIGETRFQFLERLARFRNLHAVDDATGTLNWVRGVSGGPGATLVEGRNILKGRIALDNSWAVSQACVTAQNFGNDEHWGGDAAHIHACASNAGYTGNRQLTILAEQPGDTHDAQMRANHELDLNALRVCEALITVQGWTLDDGSLWLDHLREPITVQSPMLVPTDSFTLFLRGAKCTQDSVNGTLTELNLTIARGLGSDQQVDITGLA